MDRITEALKHVEGREFIARCGIANNTRQLRNIFYHDGFAWVLQKHLDVVAGRLQHLLMIQYDKQYTHPYDTSIAAYLWLLISNGWKPDYTFNPGNTDLGALFWARQISREQVKWDD